MAKHALLSPSAAHRWMICPASVGFTRDMPNTTSPYAEEGTKAHRLCELLAIKEWGALSLGLSAELEARLAEADDEMREAAQAYIEEIRKRRTDCVSYFSVEKPLSIAFLTGERFAQGTCDCVMVADNTLYVIDFKYGKGVPVSPVENPQLTIYGLAAYEELDVFTQASIREIQLLIVQPRIGNVSQWGFSAMDITEKAFDIKGLAKKALACAEEYKLGDFHPDEKACRFCLGKGTCPALKTQVEQAVLAEFGEAPLGGVQVAPSGIPVPTDAEGLGKAMHWIPLIKTWADAVEASVNARLTAGDEVPGFKLVAGRPGPRKWSDPVAAESVLKKSLRVGEVYEKKLISPTAAAKLAKVGTIAPNRWERLSSLIVRSEAKPTVVPDSDPREALPSVRDAFEALPDETN